MNGAQHTTNVALFAEQRGMSCHLDSKSLLPLTWLHLKIVTFPRFTQIRSCLKLNTGPAQRFGTIGTTRHVCQGVFYLLLQVAADCTPVHSVVALQTCHATSCYAWRPLPRLLPNILQVGLSTTLLAANARRPRTRATATSSMAFSTSLRILQGRASHKAASTSFLCGLHQT